MPTLAPLSSTEEIDELLERASAAAAERRRLKRARQKKIIAAAIVGSLLLHLLLAPVLSWVVSHWPRKPLKPGTAPFQLSIVRSNEQPYEQKNANANAKQNPDYLRTTDEQAAEKAPEKEDFISDKNTLAAAQLTADNSKPPLPSQDGKPIPTYDFDTTPYRPGKEASSAATAAAQASQQTAPAPNETPQPDRKQKALDSKTKTSPKTAAATPTPAPDGELTSMKAQPTPADEPPHPDETPSDTPPPPVARKSSNAPSQATTSSSVSSTGLPKTPGYQPQTIQSKMSGSINNRGRPAANAHATPLGRYQKGVQDAIGSMWYMEVERQMSFLVHTSEVRLHFYVTRSGRVKSVRVSGGDPNNTLASLSIGAVSEAEIAPIPPDVADTLPGGELEVDMGFEFYMQ